MFKSGLIVGAVMFLFVLGLAAIISPFCALCVPLLTGLGAGYLAGVFDKPLDNREAAKRGAGAGAIAAGLAIFAQLIASVVNSLVLQNPNIRLGKSGAQKRLTLLWYGRSRFYLPCALA